MSDSDRVRVLCVDDEPQVLEGLTLHLRKHFEIHTAASGAEGLEKLRTTSFSIVLSDMRMPEMDGATFLGEVQTVSPTTVRMLLTGEASIMAATRAVNEGQIFRFLLKPCPPKQLLASFNAALEQHRLLTAERVLLQKTLLGSVKALIDVLAIVNPVAFSRATRIKQYASELSNKLRLRDRWQVEAAAMLSQLGYIALPPETVDKLYYGESLSETERVMVAGVPKVAQKLLGSVPRLEPVLEMSVEATK